MAKITVTFHTDKARNNSFNCFPIFTIMLLITHTHTRTHTHAHTHTCAHAHTTYTLCMHTQHAHAHTHSTRAHNTHAHTHTQCTAVPQNLYLLRSVHPHYYHRYPEGLPLSAVGVDQLLKQACHHQLLTDLLDLHS
jgi:hypothetical protein